MVFNLPKDVRSSSGIYKISSKIDNRVYIGSAIHFRLRYCRHRNSLIKNKHHCIHLQNFFNKYGGESLVFEVIEVINNPSKSLLQQRENFFFSKYENRFNTAPYSYTMLGFKFGDRTDQNNKIKIARNRAESKRLQSEIANKLWLDNDFRMKRKKSHTKAVTSKKYRDNMSEIIRQRWKDPYMRNKIMKAKLKTSQSEEYKEKPRKQMTGSGNNNAVINERIARSIKIDISKKELTLQQIADKHGIKKHIVEDIKYRNAWNHVSI